MSKRSRTFQPSTSGNSPDSQPLAGSTPDDVGGATTATPPVPTAPKATSASNSRADARRRSTAPKAAAQQSFFDRYKVIIIGGAGVVVVLFALLFVTRSATKAYECVTFLTPPPSVPASPAPGQTPLVGFPTQDMGAIHTVQGSTISYAYCPPASGRHYSLGGGQAPLARRFYGPADSVVPPQWIHNLEHGNVVMLYRGDPGPEVLDELRSVMDEAAVSSWALENCGPINKVVTARFDDMDPGVNFAAVGWDRVLLLEEFDRDALLTFAEQWQDGPQISERVCG